MLAFYNNKCNFKIIYKINSYNYFKFNKICKNNKNNNDRSVNFIINYIFASYNFKKSMHAHTSIYIKNIFF